MESIKQLFESYFDDSVEYKLIELQIRGDRNNKILEVFVDNADGVDIEELSKISHDLNTLLEKDNGKRNVSKLVVSSPGIDRPFKYIWQLKKHIGRILELTTTGGQDFEGKLLEVNDDLGSYVIIDVSVKGKQKTKSRESEKNLHKIFFKDILESKIKLSF